MSNEAFRRAVWPMVAGAVLVGVLFLGVFPARTWVAQRRTHRAVAARVKILEAQNRRLEARVRELHTDTEIERIAREQYNLVRPGEEAYALLPQGLDDTPSGAATAPTTTVAPVKAAPTTVAPRSSTHTQTRIKATPPATTTTTTDHHR